MAAELSPGRSGIRARLGPPTTVEAVARANRHAPATDSLIRWRYPGLSVALVRSGYNGRELLTGVTATGGTLELPLGIRIGRSTGTQLAALLGPPFQTGARGDTLVVTFAPPTEGADEYVHLYLARDTLRRVRWDFYVD